MASAAGGRSSRHAPRPSTSASASSRGSHAGDETRGRLFTRSIGDDASMHGSDGVKARICGCSATSAQRRGGGARSV